MPSSQPSPPPSSRVIAGGCDTIHSEVCPKQLRAWRRRFEGNASERSEEDRPSERAAMSKWIEEELEPGLRIMYGLKETMHSGKSKFQI